MIGTGKNETYTVAGDKLSSSEAVIKTGDEIPLPGPVKDTHKMLSQKIFE